MSGSDGVTKCADVARSIEVVGDLESGLAVVPEERLRQTVEFDDVIIIAPGPADADDALQIQLCPWNECQCSRIV